MGNSKRKNGIDMGNSKKQLVAEFSRSLNVIIEGRTRTLSKLISAHASARAMSQMEASRLKKKLGSQHPRTRKAQEKLRSQLGLVKALTREWEASTIRAPSIAKDEALIHGRVMDEEGRGIEGALVSLRDAEGNPLPGLDRSLTDKAGYYAFKFTRDAVDKAIETTDGNVKLAIESPSGRPLDAPPKPVKIRPGTRFVRSKIVARRDITAEAPGKGSAAAGKIRRSTATRRADTAQD